MQRARGERTHVRGGAVCDHRRGDWVTIQPPRFRCWSAFASWKTFVPSGAMKHRTLLPLLATLLATFTSAQSALSVPGLPSTHFMPAQEHADLELRLSRGQVCRVHVEARGAAKVRVEVLDAQGKIVVKSDPVWRHRDITVRAPSTGSYSVRVTNVDSVPDLVTVEVSR